MKFGVYIPNLKEENPSGASFEQATLRELIKAGHGHQLYVFTHSKVEGHEDPDVTYVSTLEFRLGFWKRTFFRVTSFVLSGVLKVSSSGKLKLAWVFMQKELTTTSLNKALIRHEIRLFWHTFSEERIDIPYIYGVLDCNHWIHPYQPEFAASALSWSELDANFRNIIAQATYVIASTEVLKKQIIHIHRVIASKVRVIPFFTPEIAKSVFVETGNSLADELPDIFLFYPARLMSQKNHITILLGLKLLKEKYGISIPMVFVGGDSGNKDFILRKIEELQLDKQVMYFGKVSFQDLAMMYKKAFALVYASLNGPDNFPPLEAFSMGCPVIASRLEGAGEQLGDSALFFDPLNEAELAERIYELYSSQDLRDQLISRGWRKSIAWTAEDYVRSLLEIVDEFAILSRSWDSNFTHISRKWDILTR